MKLSELKSIIMECIDELNEGPARDHRQVYGKLQDTGEDSLKHPRARKLYYQNRKSHSRISSNSITKGSGINTKITKPGILNHTTFGKSKEPVYTLDKKVAGQRIKRGSFKDMDKKAISMHNAKKEKESDANEYNRDLKLRIRNTGRNGILPPPSRRR